MAFYWVVFVFSSFDDWRFQKFSGLSIFITNFYLFTNDYVGTEDLKLFLCSIHRISVVFAAIFSIYSKVDSFPPQTPCFWVLSHETRPFVDYFWICSTGSMPKPRALWRYAIFRSHAYDFSLVKRPKMKILDDLNWKDLSVIRFHLLELSVDNLPNLACFVKFGHFEVFLLTVLLKRIFPLIWVVLHQKFCKRTRYPPADFILFLPTDDN